ncbi:PepSY domain-containing protein [Microbacterium sp. lyk4-40-TSB-66]|uniref:PepSY domain-containing protein n=1 Tax=Microbacterium sp. lyk4-40-TSB-66 TaxID=3040294 RepID=UPI00254E4265|nr:PepSY domain-containing protein [Microbacterium sp. lyk4-40-TSB-66]
MAPTRIPGIALLIVAGGLILSACAPATGGGPVPGSSDAPGSAASGATALDDDGRTAVTAITTAEASAGGRGFELERGDDDAWEVHVAVGEREVEVRVASDGTTVQSSQDHDGIDAEERAALDAAVTTLADAVRIATAQNPGGERVDEVQLEEDDGTWVWEVEVRDGTTVRVAAADGAVL